MGNLIGKLIKKYENYRAFHGYTCDCCGREVFDYPQNRLCESCGIELKNIERTCPKCGRKTAAEGVCLECKARMPQFLFAVSALAYEGGAASMINRFKNGEKYLAYFFAERLEALISARFRAENIDLHECLFTCVPDRKEDRKNRKDRYYNPAEVLAKTACERLNAAFYGEMLVKSRETRPQKKMTRTERFENVRGAYRVHERAKCKGRTVAVFDDILTTGATGDECARILLAAGASRVIFITAVSVAEKAQFPEFAE